MANRPNLSRLARLKKGTQVALPGQDPRRKDELRIELEEALKPADFIEHMWVEEIAWRTAIIQVLRSQRAGLSCRLVQTARDKLVERAEMERLEASGASGGELEMRSHVPLSAGELEVVERWENSYLAAAPQRDFLHDSTFAWLLSSISREDQAMVRQLQVQEHEEVRERDRIINQFERRRRLAARHLIELLEARRRGCSSEDLEMLLPRQPEGNLDGSTSGAGRRESDANKGDLNIVVGSSSLLLPTPVDPQEPEEPTVVEPTCDG